MHLRRSAGRSFTPAGRFEPGRAARPVAVAVGPAAAGPVGAVVGFGPVAGARHRPVAAASAVAADSAAGDPAARPGTAGPAVAASDPAAGAADPATAGTAAAPAPGSAADSALAPRTGRSSGRSPPSTDFASRGSCKK